MNLVPSVNAMIVATGRVLMRKKVLAARTKDSDPFEPLLPLIK